MRYSRKGKVIDLEKSHIVNAEVVIADGIIEAITPCSIETDTYILPGLVDSHIHIESSMSSPVEFAKVAVIHGTVATVSDPHEIANVCGIEGINYMIRNSFTTPFKFFFGAPSCVPATSFETTGATINSDLIKELMTSPHIHFLSEMMNYPGVIYGDAEVMAKIQAAKNSGKPIDGHAPMLSGEDLKKYVNAGISTDHECNTVAEGLEKARLGMKIQIRQGSAAKNFDLLHPLFKFCPNQLMFCSDDLHPEDLLHGHINLLVKKAIQKGYDLFDVLRAASINAIEHYNLPIGRLRVGDPADYIIVDNLKDFNVLETYIDGNIVAKNGQSFLHSERPQSINNFYANDINTQLLKVPDKCGDIKAIQIHNSTILTDMIVARPLSVNGFFECDIQQDLLKLVVLNRYQKAKPVVCFVKGFSLQKGAIATSVAHDSHNIIAIGCSDQEIVHACELIIQNKGAMVATADKTDMVLPLDIAGLMSSLSVKETAESYAEINTFARECGCKLNSPYMTMSFLSLPVIPSLKITDKGLFDVNSFCFTDLYL